MSDDDRPRVGRVLAVIAVTAMALMWIYIFSGAASEDPPDSLTDPSFAAAAEPRCAAAVAEVDTLPSADEVADAVERAAVLDDAMKDGHAIACADYLGLGSDQIVVGWRAMHPPGAPGIKLFTPLDDNGKKWRETVVSGEELAVEDIKAADLDGDGRPDIVAAARQTKNLKIFFAQDF